MALVDKADVKLGFWIALGFFLFALVMAVGQYLMMKMRGQN